VSAQPDLTTVGGARIPVRSGRQQHDDGADLQISEAVGIIEIVGGQVDGEPALVGLADGGHVVLGGRRRRPPPMALS